ncbi:MAG: gamma carbonic anhydrase family protein [Selenomonas ruminantium]|jgi:carbonic anhydrase/acetyltransferase-like protein (isoleucine patch superfamily)|uniref:Gamma carbonic anhydrase family protein n=1 Tax=Selenomonas ruminantium TaxID=971 RepID=A0A928A2D8_SELRU|nr:gamma carbonic anhydrase family protein [Selenomonas ruminantium]
MMSTILSYQGKTPTIGKDVFMAPSATVVGDVEIGEGSRIWFNAVVRGDFQKVTIGKNCDIQDNSTLHVMLDEPTEIGDNVIIGHNAVVHARKIGSNCLIGMGSIILGHTEIGDNVVIGAGTKLTQHKKIPSNSLVYGNPAELIRALREDEIEALKASGENYQKVAAIYQEELDKIKNK